MFDHFCHWKKDQFSKSLCLSHGKNVIQVGAVNLQAGQNIYESSLTGEKQILCGCLVGEKKRKWQVKDGKCGYLVEPTMQYSRLACPQQISESRQRLVVPSCNWFFFCPACNRHLMQMLRTKESTIDIQLNYASFTIRGHLRKHNWSPISNVQFRQGTDRLIDWYLDR